VNILQRSPSVGICEPTAIRYPQSSSSIFRRLVDKVFDGLLCLLIPWPNVSKDCSKVRISVKKSLLPNIVRIFFRTKKPLFRNLVGIAAPAQQKKQAATRLVLE
jgi:hypothetical protein